MLIERQELCDLIPHAGDMCLLDGVLQWDEQSIECVSRSHQSMENPLRKNDQLSSIHAVEYGAQAMAVHGGLIAKEKGEQAPPGYLAACRDVVLHANRLDDVEERLIVRAEQLIAGSGNLMYNLRIYTDDKEIATARATVIVR